MGTNGESTADSTADSSGTTTGAECADASECDDGVDCTDDTCVAGECVNTTSDALCDDGIECTTDICDAVAGCMSTTDDSLCDDGVECTTDTCDAVAGCMSTTDDSLCDDGVGCTTDTCDAAMGCIGTPDDTVCDDGIMCTTNVCDPKLDCQAVGDDTMCDDSSPCTTDTCDLALGCQNVTAVLVYNGSNGSSTSPEDAITSLGHTAIVTNDEATFNAAFDAGGFSVIIVDNPSTFGTVPPDMHTRLESWVAGGERLIFGFWNLDDDPTMQATLNVSVVASLDPAPPIFPDPASPIDLFATPDAFPSPLAYVDGWADNGDELALVGGGFVAGRFTDAATGAGAILVTQGDRVITNGFMISEAAVPGGTDGDGDGILDGEELLRNEYDFLCSAP